MVFCPVIVADQRLRSKRKTHQNQNRNQVHLHHNPHSRNPVVSVCQQRPVRQRDPDTLHQIRNGRRNPDCQNLPNLGDMNMKSRRVDGKPPAFL